MRHKMYVHMHLFNVLKYVIYMNEPLVALMIFIPFFNHKN
jgi:hypothetical protein